MRSRHLPVTVLSGFLGAGRTTLLDVGPRADSLRAALDGRLVTEREPVPASDPFPGRDTGEVCEHGQEHGTPALAKVV